MTAPEHRGELGMWEELTLAAGDRAEAPQAPVERVAEAGDESKSAATQGDGGAGSAHASKNDGPASGIDIGTEGQITADEDAPGMASNVRSATAGKDQGLPEHYSGSCTTTARDFGAPN